MNICFLEGDMSRQGGTERMTAWLANALAEKHRVFVISSKLENREVFFPLADSVSHTVLPPASGKWGILRHIRQIRRFLKQNAIDRVINVDIGMAVYGIPAARGTRAKVVTWEHSNFFNNWGSPSFAHIRRFGARHSDAVVVLTERDKKNYTSHIRGCKPITVIPNPAKKYPYTYDPASKIILSAGLLCKIKRFDLVVPIGKLVFARHPDWQWVLCGDGPEREALEKAVREAGLAKNVCFLGSVRDMDERYANAAMYVLTSEMEGLPMVLLEAKSHGLPIVSFDIETGPSDIVRDTVNGYLVPSGDTNTMAERICRLIEDAELRARFSENAALDMEKFDGERIIQQWETLLQSL